MLKTEFLNIEPVLSSSDIKRDIAWYEKQMGFSVVFGDELYVGLAREGQRIHLQRHANNSEGPVYGSVVKFFVKSIESLFEEFVNRGTVKSDEFQSKTDWGTKEFGFYDLNRNAIYFVEDL